MTQSNLQSRTVSSAQGYAADVPFGAYTPLPRLAASPQKRSWPFAAALLATFIAPFGVFNALGARSPVDQEAAPKAPEARDLGQGDAVIYPDVFYPRAWKFESGTVKHTVDGVDRWHLVIPVEIEQGLDVSETIRDRGANHVVVTELTFNYGKGAVSRSRRTSYYLARDARWRFGAADQCWFKSTPGPIEGKYCE